MPMTSPTDFMAEPRWLTPVANLRLSHLQFPRKITQSTLEMRKTGRTLENLGCVRSLNKIRATPEAI